MGGERAQLAVLVSWIRWAGVLLAGGEALFAQPAPISVPGALAATALLAAVNVPASLARRLSPAAVERVLLAGVLGDFAALTAWLLLSANDPQDVTFTTYFVAAAEMAAVYRWRGVPAFSVGAVLAMAAAFWERADLFHIPSDPGNLALRCAMVVMVAVLLGRTSETSERRRAQALRESFRNEALHLVASRLSQTLKREYVLETVVDALHRLYPERWHGILLKNDEGVLVLRHVRGTPDRMTLIIRDPSRYERGPITFSDLRSSERVARIRDDLPPELLEYAAAIAVPLRARDDLLGLLVTLDRRPGSLDASEVAFMEALAGHASLALENARLYEEVETLSLTDVTTALANRRAFDRRLLDELERAERYQVPLSLLMIDVDHFKLYNDTHGHLAGDMVLRRLGELLAGGHLRASDVPSRFGGEEFAVIMPHTEVDAALATAERVREAVAEAAFPDAEAQPLGTITVSIGVAGYPGDASSARELVERADLALYEAKHAGRNQVVRFRPAPLGEGASAP